MKSERVEILVCGFECCMLDTKKVLSFNKLNSVEIFVLLKLKLSKNKKYSKFIIRGRQRNPLQEGDICLLQQAKERHLSHQLQ